MTLLKYRKIIPLVLLVIASSCTEQYVFQNQHFEDALVIEATLTNELIHQQIQITRSLSLQDLVLTVESGADVKITDSDGQIHVFEEKSGAYLSREPFKAEPGKKYKLQITTANGKSYVSEEEQLPTINAIDLQTNVVDREGVNGVEISVKSFDKNNTSKYYRYEYEETYQIKTPWDITYSLEYGPINLGDGYPQRITKPLTESISECYSTNYSEPNIIQKTTVNFTEDRIDFPIRFIANNAFEIRNRYSILVKQYTESFEAYTYFNTLNKLSESKSILSPNQPGFIIGNIVSIDSPNEKVVGYFEVASISQKRIFFNFKDVFPDLYQPEYNIKCTAGTYDMMDPKVISALEKKELYYLADGPYMLNFNGSLYLLKPECADCTTFSSNKKPSFWEN